MRRRLGTLTISLVATNSGRRFLVMSGSGPTEGESARGELPADRERPAAGTNQPHAEPDVHREGQKAGTSSRSAAWKLPGLRRFFSQPSEGRDRAYYEGLSRDEKRALYACGRRYRTLDDIPAWTQTGSGDNGAKKAKLHPLPEPRFSVNPDLNDKVSLWRGDITTLEIDAVVNAANSSLMGGGGVDGAIHSAAGWSLRDECEQLGGCDVGDTKLTSGHRLPAKYILHTVGPMNRSGGRLRSCYETALQLVLEHKIQTVAFSCISTGIYGFPNEAAAHIALGTVRQWLETGDNAENVTRIIFCVFLEKDLRIYQRLLHQYFPLSEDPRGTAGATGEDVGGREEGEDVGGREEGEDVGGREEEKGGGTPPPESPEGVEEGGGDGGRAADDADGGDVPPAPRLKHHATAPAGSLPVSKTASSRGELEKSAEREGDATGEDGDTKEKREVEEQPAARPEAREEPMDISPEPDGGVVGDGAEGTSRGEGQALGGQHPPEVKETDKIETAV